MWISIHTNQSSSWTIIPWDISDQLPRLTKSAVTGISVAIAGNIIISLALNCQKLAHRRLERDREARSRESELQPQTGNGRGESNEPTSSHNGDLDPFNTPTSPTYGAAILETEPLLNGEITTHYGADDETPSERRPTWFSRLWSPNAKKRHLVHDSDASHLASAHVLIPVDVVHPTRPENEQRPSKDLQKDNDNRTESNYLKSKLWWVGFLLMNLGETGNFISYAFAPASVVAPLGTFALIANCFFAPLLLGERFRKRDFFGIVVAIVGAVTVVLSANASATKLTPKALIEAISQHVFIGYAAVYIVGAIILSSLSERDIGSRWVYIDVGLCALFGGFTVLSTKAISSLLTLEWFQMFTEWITYPVIAVLIGTGVCQIRYLNRALMRFDSKIVVPTQFVLFNLSAIVGSAILYGDFRRATFHQIVTFLYGCAATFAGVFIIAWSPATPASPEDSFSVSEDESAELGLVRPGSNSAYGSLARRNRATLVVPDSLQATPVLNRKKSISFGLSPAQRVLILHTPPSEDYMRPLPHDAEHAGTSTPGSVGRRRAVSWLEEDLLPQRYQSLRSNTNNSDSGSRSQSRAGALTRTTETGGSPS